MWTRSVEVAWYAADRVSDDNAYAERLFGTAKYRPDHPARGSADLEAART